MGLTALAHKLSSSVSKSPAYDASEPTNRPLTNTSTDRTHSANMHSENGDKRANLLHRIFSVPSRKASRGTSGHPESSAEHFVTTTISSGSLQNVPKHVKANTRPTSSDGRTVLKRIFSTSAKEDAGQMENHAPNRKVCLIPPNYNRAFHHRVFPLKYCSKGEWALDLVTLSGNGIRAEMRDMYAMFANLEKRPTMLTLEDVDLFVDWFGAFLNVLEELFELEEACLYPWIEGVDTLSHERRMWETDRRRVTGELSEGKRIRRKGYLIGLGNEIKHCSDLFERRPVAEGLPVLAEIVEKFVTQLMEYTEAKERDLPVVIQRYLRLSDRSRFERIYWGTAREYQCHEFTIVVATRWMDTRKLRKWKRRVLGIFGNGAYADWKRTFCDDHYFIVAEFENRVFQSEAERIAQVEENEIARARAQVLPASGAAEYTDSEAPSAVSSSCASTVQRSHNFATPLSMLPFVM